MFRNKAVLFILALVIAGAVGYYFYNSAQKEKLAKQTASVPKVQPEERFLLTVFLKHDQSKTLGEIQKKLNETGFYRNFPPAGTEIESWKVVMGIGQVITLRVPPSKLREVNVALERMAWGSFRTEFYPTYDFVPIYRTLRDSTSKDTTTVTE